MQIVARMSKTLQNYDVVVGFNCYSSDNENCPFEPQPCRPVESNSTSLLPSKTMWLRSTLILQFINFKNIYASGAQIYSQVYPQVPSGYATVSYNKDWDTSLLILGTSFSIRPSKS